MENPESMVVVTSRLVLRTLQCINLCCVYSECAFLIAVVIRYFMHGHTVVGC